MTGGGGPSRPASGAASATVDKLRDIIGLSDAEVSLSLVDGGRNTRQQPITDSRPNLLVLTSHRANLSLCCLDNHRRSLSTHPGSSLNLRSIPSRFLCVQAARLALVASSVANLPADEAWRVLSSHLSPHHPFPAHELLYLANYSTWKEAEHGPAPCTLPDPEVFERTAAADFMTSWDSPAWVRRRRRRWRDKDDDVSVGEATAMMVEDFRALHRASVEDPASFWAHVARRAGVPPSVLGDGSEVLRFDVSSPGGSERWLPNAKLNIAETCFAGKAAASVALVWSREGETGEGRVHAMTRGELRTRADAIASALVAAGLGVGARVAVVLPMTAECVPLYLGIVLAGASVVCVADSFAPEEIAVRLVIGSVDAVVTQDDVVRDGRRLPLYGRVAVAVHKAAVEQKRRGCIPVIVMACAAESCVSVEDEHQHPGPCARGSASAALSTPLLRRCDIAYVDFLRRGHSLLRAAGGFRAAQMSASAPTAILFSSGTTGTPKAIPWDHVAPLHGISDGNLHMDVKAGDVAVWPTNLGWMMGSWLIYQLANGAAVGVFEGSPTSRQFGEFISEARVTMLGLVPSIVANWRVSGCMEGLDWSSHLRCFALTGEASSPSDTLWLASRVNGYKAPVLEYCGGTELASGYACSATCMPNAPSCFSSQALGGSFVLLVDEEQEPSAEGARVGTRDERVQHQWREAGECEAPVSGEVAVRTPYLGSSTSLLNGDNHGVYYEGMPRAATVAAVAGAGAPLRRHGDRFERLPGGFYRAAGRTDDAFNLGGIKTSSVEIERVCNAAAAAARPGGVLETAAVAVPPPGGGPDRLWIIVVPKQSQLGLQRESGVDPNALRGVFSGAIRRGLNPLFHVHAVLISPGGLPRNASNKILRRVVRDWCVETQEREERERRAKL